MVPLMEFHTNFSLNHGTCGLNITTLFLSDSQQSYLYHDISFSFAIIEIHTFSSSKTLMN